MKYFLHVQRLYMFLNFFCNFTVSRTVRKPSSALFLPLINSSYCYAKDFQKTKIYLRRREASYESACSVSDLITSYAKVIVTQHFSRATCPLSKKHNVNGNLGYPVSRMILTVFTFTVNYILHNLTLVRALVQQ